MINKNAPRPLSAATASYQSKLCIAISLTLAGCSTFDPAYDTYADKHSAHQLVSRDDFEPIDLPSLINGVTPLPKEKHETEQAKEIYHRKQGASIDKAFLAFSEKYRLHESTGRSRRTEIQERILAASDQRCNDFKTLLQKKAANVSFNTGLIATGTALAATIVDNANTSKILSGFSGLSSGFRAEYNQAYFANAAIQVIVAGIDSRRRTAYEQIRHARSETLASYPLEAAVKDAIRYHGLCSTVSGLQEAGEAVRYYNEPGITAATRTIARSKMLIDIQGANADQVVEKLRRWQEVIPAERYLTGNPLGDETAEREVAGQELMDYYANGAAKLASRAAKIAAEVRVLDKSIIDDADKTRVEDVAARVSGAVTTSCKPAFVEKSAILVDLQAQRSVADEKQATQLSHQITQELLAARILRESMGYLISDFNARSDKIDQAIAALKDPKNTNAALDLKNAVGRYKAMAPTIAAGCKVTSLE